MLPDDYGKVVPVREKYKEQMSPFPGGSGFLMNSGILAGKPGEKRYMVVAHNYDGVANLNNGENYKSAFWDALFIYLGGAGILREDVFLTNYYMGANPASTIGEMVSHGAPTFATKCHELFEEQVMIVDPKLVIAMGIHVEKALKNWNQRSIVFVPHTGSKWDAVNREMQCQPAIRKIRSAIEHLA